ncbi:MAG: phosphatidylglycerophosphatase A [Pseudomonadota bacterium]
MKIDPAAIRPNLRDPIQFLAFGFGSGLSPIAPGTAGTLLALALYWLAPAFTPAVHAFLLVPITILGVWLCGSASRALGVHDHGGIVWDEFVGLWIAVWAIPKTAGFLCVAFLLFRLFDIVKPWPIGWLDANTRGGFGIMIDDIVAGVMANVVLMLCIQTEVLAVLR